LPNVGELLPTADSANPPVSVRPGTARGISR
jgi:hypothetical protein